MTVEVVAKLRKNLARALRAGHPWVFRDALEPFAAPPGAVVTVRDRRGGFVARGIAEAGPIAVRLWTSADEPVDEALVRRRIREALALRRMLALRDTDAVRLVHGEGDRLGGVVCDRYGAHAVVRLDGRGVLRWRELLVAVLRQEAAAQGLELRGVLLEHGRRGARTVEAVAGTVPDEPVPVREHGMLLFADLRRGQKTGLFLDHRDSRRAVRELSSGLAVLDLYGYSGSFSVAAGLGGAQEALTVDRSEAALALAARAWRGNDLDPARHEVLATDVPRWLETGVGAERRWDLVVADPPSFAPSADAVPAALAGYARLHAGCLARVRDGGLYLAASCSSHVDRPAFEETLRRGAAGARRVIQVLGRWGAAPDHPRLLAFPEGDYLKVVLCRVGR